jgi:predicted phage terminase large subunit-like protein
MSAPLSVVERAYLEETGRRVRNSLLDFTEFTAPWYKSNWHHKLICSYLEKWVRREEGFRRIMLFMPAQNGKSELVSKRLPAFTLGNNPDCHFLAASYSASLASEFNRDLQLIIESKEYQATFPGVKLPSARDRGYTRTTEQIDLLGQRGGYRSTGVGGSITGHGAHYIVIDDPIKNAEEAESEVYREKIWQWYATTAYTRQTASDAAILITVTRWHEDDLCGRLLELSKKGGEQWLVLRFPAIADGDLTPGDPRRSGEPLWPERYPLEMLQRVRPQVGERVWSAMYQQTPTSAEGAEIKRHWWKWYQPHEKPASFDSIVSSWDCAAKSGRNNDFSVGTVWGARGPDRYLLDVIRGRFEFVELVDAIRNTVEKWRPNATLIEDASNGIAAVQVLRKEVSGIIPIKPSDLAGGGNDASKVARARAASHQIRAGNVWLPTFITAKTSSSGENISEMLVEECAAFPLGAHDDMVDSMSQALIYMLHFNRQALPGEIRSDNVFLSPDRTDVLRNHPLAKLTRLK